MSATVRIRLTGTRDELSAAVAALGAVFALREVSDFHPNRGGSVLGRVYVEAQLPATRPEDPTRETHP